MIKKSAFSLVLLVGVAVSLFSADSRLTAVEAGVPEAAAAPFEVGFMPSVYIGAASCGLAACDLGGSWVCCNDPRFPDTCVRGDSE